VQVALYPSFGEFSDWAYDEATGGRFAYCIELGPRRYGFE
jgi:hypothetical protein